MCRHLLTVILDQYDLVIFGRDFTYKRKWTCILSSELKEFKIWTTMNNGPL